MYHLIFIVKIKIIMKVCIIGDGLTGLALAKALANYGISVDIISTIKIKKYNKIRTLGISKSNIDFFNKYILNIEKLLWKIKKIEIYNENLKNEKILNFENDNEVLFSTIKNFELNKLLLSDLKKNKLIKFKKLNNKLNIIKLDYKLIFNCDNNNSITKNLFYKKIDKSYNSFAYTTIIEHEELIDNHCATQTFTKVGPIAFLPLSKSQTSVVYSIKGKNKICLEDLIKKYNIKYEIKKIDEILNFELKSSSLRFYHYKNILAFGDLLHRIHPLAGQGFNMSIRDLKEVLELIKLRIDHGLDLDHSICIDFEKKTRHKNYLFLSGVDFIYEFFNFENEINKNFLSRSVKFLGKNKTLNNFFTKFADKGIII